MTRDQEIELAASVQYERITATTENSTTCSLQLFQLPFLGLLLAAFGMGISVVSRRLMLSSDAQSTDPILLQKETRIILALSDVIGFLMTLLCSHFVLRNRTSGASQKSCTPITGSLLSRFLVRNLLPLLLAGVLVFGEKEFESGKKTDYTFTDSNDNRVASLSDLIAQVSLVLVYVLIDRVLEYFWPMDPWQDAKAQLVSDSTSWSRMLSEGSCQMSTTLQTFFVSNANNADTSMLLRDQEVGSSASVVA